MGISEEQAIRWFDSIGHIGRSGVGRILLWRHTGIPAEPPASLYRFDDWPDEQILAWRAAGFTVEEMIELIEFPLDSVVPWHREGRPAAEIAELLRANFDVTSKKDPVGDSADLRGWVGHPPHTPSDPPDCDRPDAGVRLPLLESRRSER